MDLLLLTLVIGLIILVVFLYKKISDLQKPASDTTLLEWLKTMQKSIDVTNKTINESLSSSSSHMVRTLQENSKQLNERLDKAAQVIAGVGREVGEMSEIGRSMKELQEFLKSPKLRGNIGEQVLRDLITQMFPKNSFHLQYQFHSGEKVDAAIRTDAGILPIDSKFPMENFIRLMKAKAEVEKKALQREFGRDVRKHIDAIAKKYILPDEGTMDFALMYVPSEAVFYEIVNMNEVVEYAKGRRVYIVSPSTLYVHLQTILLSFEGRKIEAQTREVLRLLRALQVDYGKVNNSMDVLGKHIGNASNQYSNVQKGFMGLGQKLESVKYLSESTTESTKQMSIEEK
jgi:DNA recombination protein RmuC